MKPQPPITGDRHGRPDVPWDEWTTHCRVARNQGVLMKCNHPVEYRGNTLYQCCGECPKARKEKK